MGLTFITMVIMVMKLHINTVMFYSRHGDLMNWLHNTWSWKQIQWKKSQTRILKPNENQPEPFLTSTDEQSMELMLDQFELSVEPLTAVASVRGADPGSDSELSVVLHISPHSRQTARAAPLMGFMTNSRTLRPSLPEREIITFAVFPFQIDKVHEL
ncbi:hypothetical protein INR49_020758 [Caranx melampygus]|nr:hypothetical protein INR49_020758 [Caranx melampygus]